MSNNATCLRHSAGLAPASLAVYIGVMAAGSMKIIVLLSIFFVVSCVPHIQGLAKSERICAFDKEQKKLAWANVVKTLMQEHPEHSKYCETEVPASSKTFAVLDGECRVYLACAKSVNGSTLLHGDWIVTVNELTQEVIEFYEVAW